MTGRERALRALNFEPVDRPPLAGGLLQNAAFLAEAAGVSDFWADPRRTAFEAFRALGCDVVLGPVMPKRPEDTTTDAYGRPTDFTVVHAKPELTTPEQVADWAERHDASTLRASFDMAAACADYLNHMQAGQADAGDMLFIGHCLGYAPTFPTSDGHFSYEAFLMACALYPERMWPLFETWGEQARLRLEAVASVTLEHGLLRLIWIGQDLCDARGPMLSPRLMDTLYFPALRHALEPLQQAGIRTVWHTDANYRQLLPAMIELGLDGFQGFYETPEGITIEHMAGLTMRSGRPPILFGSISTVWVLPHGSPADVRREVERCVDASEGRAPLLLAPSSSIGPEVPAANVRALFDHARTYRPSWSA